MWLFFQVTAQPDDEAGFTDEELWDKAVRNILLRFDSLFDFLKDKFKLNQKGSGGGSLQKASSVGNLLLQRNYQEQLQTYELYQGLLKRDKELYELECEVHEIKCALLRYLGENIPPAPQYKPLPHVDIQLPIKPLMPAPTKKPQQKRQERAKNNELFRSIMENKADEYENYGDAYDVDEEDLSGSWEDIPMTEIGDSIEISHHIGETEAWWAFKNICGKCTCKYSCVFVWA